MSKEDARLLELVIEEMLLVFPLQDHVYADLDEQTIRRLSSSSSYVTLAIHRLLGTTLDQVLDQFLLQNRKNI